MVKNKILPTFIFSMRYLFATFELSGGGEITVNMARLRCVSPAMDEGSPYRVYLFPVSEDPDIRWSVTREEYLKRMMELHAAGFIQIIDD